MDEWKKNSDDVGGVDGDIVGENRCLICHSNTSSRKSFKAASSSSSSRTRRSQSSSAVLSNDLDVYLVLRHILELPSEQLANYLRHCSRRLLGDCVKICGNCDENYVEKCEKIFVELMEVKRRFNGARLKVIEAVKRSVNKEDLEPEPKLKEMRGRMKRRTGRDSHWSLMEDTRRFVVEHEYEAYDVNPFIAGDLMTKARIVIGEKDARRSKVTPLLASNEGGIAVDKDTNMSNLFHAHCYDNQEFKNEPTSPLNIENEGVLEQGSNDLVNFENEYLDDLASPYCVNEGGDEDEWNPPSESEEEETETKKDEDEWNPKMSIASRRNMRKRKPTQIKVKVTPSTPKKKKRTSKPPRQRLPIPKNQAKFYQCFICDYKAVRANRLSHHIRQNHKNDNDMEEMEVTCLFCRKSLDNILDLKVHYSLSHSQETFNCKHCNQEYSNKSDFRTHLASEHEVKDDFRFTCLFDDCGVSFYFKKELTDHKDNELHHEISYKCEVCENEYKTRRIYKQHMIRAHPEEKEGTVKKPFNCELCPGKFQRQVGLDQHMRKAHCQSSNNVDNEDNEIFNYNDNEDEANKLELNFPEKDIPKPLRTETRLEEHQTKFYECIICDYKTLRANRLSYHIKRHHKEDEDLEKVKCPFCVKLLSNKIDLIFHISSVHIDKNEKFNCRNCSNKPEFSDKWAYRSHLSSEHEIRDQLRFTCNFQKCTKSYYFKDELINHRKIHKIPHFKCKVCGNEYNQHQKKHYYQHMETWHPEENDAKKPFSCNLCPDKFRDEICLKIHMKKSHGLCSSLPSSSSSSQIQDKFKVKWKKCEVCSKLFKTDHLLQSHQIISHQTNYFQCKKCPYKAKYKATLNLHLKNFHKEIKLKIKKEENIISAQSNPNEKWKCSECGLEFRNRTHRARHRLRVHINERIICTICGFSCLENYELKRHIEHTHERKNDCCCDLCGKILSTIYNLKFHKARVHKVGNNIKFPCTVDGCGKYFEPKTLKLHVRTVHEKKRPYQCELCGKSYPTSSSMRKHERAIHTNRETKPWKCDQCGKGFAIKDYLYIHMKSQHLKKKELNNQSS